MRLKVTSHGLRVVLAYRLASLIKHECLKNFSNLFSAIIGVNARPNLAETLFQQGE